MMDEVTSKDKSELEDSNFKDKLESKKGKRKKDKNLNNELSTEEISEEKASEIKKELENASSPEFLNKAGHEKVIDLIVKKDDITWKTIILELVNKNMMDPWDINLTLLTKEYLKIIKQLKNHDFRISGKMILAAAMLLKIKSARLVEGDLNELDRLLSNTQDNETENDLGLVDEILPSRVQHLEKHQLIPRTPQARKRKVSIYDLVEALEKALEVKERRIMRRMPPLDVEIPKKTIDISILMKHLYEKINYVFQKKKNKIYFTDLVPGNTKEDIVITFIPLLHLSNSRKIDLEQQEHFGPIEILLNTNKEVQQEIEKELKT